MQIGKRNHHRNAPTTKTCERLRLGGVKPLKLITFTNLSSVFPKAQSSQSEAKKRAEIEASDTQNQQKSQKRAPQQTIKNKTTKSLSEFRFCIKSDSTFCVCLFHFWALGHPGTKMAPSLPREPPRRSQTLFVVDLCGFCNYFELTSTSQNLEPLVFETIVCSVPWQPILKKHWNKTAQLQGSRRKGTVVDSACSTLRYWSRNYKGVGDGWQHWIFWGPNCIPKMLKLSHTRLSDVW